MPPSIGSPLLWLGFTVFILCMLALDLGVFHRNAHQIRFREALGWTVVWVCLAAAFSAAIYIYFGRQRSLEFLTGYVIEYSLSVDNIFIFLLIFRYFSVGRESQHRVLFWGIIGALIMRLLFILLGTALLRRFEWFIFVFGAFVIWAGIKILKGGELQVHPERSLALRAFRAVIPTTSGNFGTRLLARQGGKVYATPLMLVLIVMEVTDVAFAADSIPAVFAITRDPFIVFTSNIFAILGLRSLYFLLADAMDRFRYLKWGLGFVLIFVGVKMLISNYLEIPTGISLAVVAGMLAASIVLSLRKPPAPVAASSAEVEPPR
jgi:tellurite resistance protein TerC